MKHTIAFSSDHHIAASSPGGMARHYRLQVFDTANDSWRREGTFRFAEEAEAEAHSLRSRGLHARIVSYRMCPVAA